MAYAFYLFPLYSVIEPFVTHLPYGYVIIIPLLCTVFLSVLHVVVRHFRLHNIESDSSLACKIMKKVGEGRWSHILQFDHAQGDDRPTMVISVWPTVVYAWATCHQSDMGSKHMKAYVYCSDAQWNAMTNPCLVASPSSSSEASAEPAVAHNDKTITISVLFKNMEKRFTYYAHIVKKFYLDVCPNSEQAFIIQKIMDIYAVQRRCVAFIEGPPGTGKSSIAALLCAKLNGVLCPFNPTRAGESFDEIKAAAEQACERKVIVVLMDEASNMLRNMRSGRAERNPHIDTLAVDKTGWNKLMDQMANELGVIVIMTSNTPKSQLDEEEIRTGLARAFLQRIFRLPKQKEMASNLRPGRVHAVFKCLQKPASVENGYLFPPQVRSQA